MTDDQQRKDKIERALCDKKVGSRPWWMGVDQYGPCYCIRLKGHDGDCWCAHTKPDNNQEGA